MPNDHFFLSLVLAAICFNAPVDSFGDDTPDSISCSPQKLTMPMGDQRVYFKVIIRLQTPAAKQFKMKVKADNPQVEVQDLVFRKGASISESWGCLDFFRFDRDTHVVNLSASAPGNVQTTEAVKSQLEVQFIQLSTDPPQPLNAPFATTRMFPGIVNITGPLDQVVFDQSQIQFDPKVWQSDSSMRPHMWVDLLRTKKLLGKTRVAMNRDFDTSGKDDGSSASYYLNPIRWAKHGVPTELNLEVHYRQQKVDEYRVVYIQGSEQQATSWVR